MIWSMDARFITLRIFKFQEKEKTRLKSDFGLFFESDFSWYLRLDSYSIASINVNLK